MAQVQARQCLNSEHRHFECPATGPFCTPVATTSGTQVHAVKRMHGIAGQVEYRATVEYPGEGRSWVAFVGSTYGGPVVMVTDAGQTFVRDPERFGAFGESWVRAFFA